VDPRCSKTAARAWKWLPVRPNGVAAVGWGMIRWIIENQRYDARYLTNANKAAAKTDNEPTWTQTAWLVKIKDGKPATFLRGSDLGLPLQKRPKKKGDGDWEFDPFIVLNGGLPKPFDPNDETTAAEGDLLVDTEINGIKVKSVLQIYKETAAAKSMAKCIKSTAASKGGISCTFCFLLELNRVRTELTSVWIAEVIRLRSRYVSNSGVAGDTINRGTNSSCGCGNFGACVCGHSQ
jgi:anaerobic selenocysteine-containing dehydrogenase